ncbi:hypothetical protein DFH06DRAFT_1132415 [Mycena polygramma]|nr:hypothetical protein DFH06DRAFT_1132415 [Mycena polygramma]
MERGARRRHEEETLQNKRPNGGAHKREAANIGLNNFVERARVKASRGGRPNGATLRRRKEEEEGGSTAERASVRCREDEDSSTLEHADVTTPRGGGGGLNDGASQRRSNEDVKDVIHDGINTQKADGLYIHSGMQLGSSRRDEMRRVPYPQRGATRSDTQDERRRALSIVGLAIRSPRKMGAVSAARCAGIKHARRDKKGAVHGGTGDMIAAQDEMGAVSAAGCAGIEHARRG